MAEDYIPKVGDEFAISRSTTGAALRTARVSRITPAGKIEFEGAPGRLWFCKFGRWQLVGDSSRFSFEDARPMTDELREKFAHQAKRNRARFMAGEIVHELRSDLVPDDEMMSALELVWCKIRAAKKPPE